MSGLGLGVYLTLTLTWNRANTQGLHSSWEQKDVDWSVDKRVISSKTKQKKQKKTKKTHGNIPGV